MKKIVVALVLVFALVMLISCSQENYELDSLKAGFQELSDSLSNNTDNDEEQKILLKYLEGWEDHLVNVDSTVTSNSVGSKAGISFVIYKGTKQVYGVGGGVNGAAKNGKISKISHVDEYTYSFNPYRVEMVVVFGE